MLETWDVACYGCDVTDSITAFPDTPDPAGTNTPAPSWADGVWAQLEKVIHSGWIIYVVAGTLAALLLISLTARRKRTTTETAGSKADLTGTDRAVTRITGILATAVVATGAWKVFGDVLHLHWFFRGVLFFFAEAQIVAAWRRIRRHIHRHAELGTGTRTIYGIALGSATVAAWDADSPVEVLLRFFAAFVAAYMIVEELAEELDIHLEANPHLRTEARKKAKRGLFGVKWALTPERIMVWLRLAEPTERTVEQVERQRRIARMARTAHRLQLLKDAEAADWRIGWARRSLRRQTESANERLNIAGDHSALGAVRSQLALLFEVEDSTTRAAVVDASPLSPAPTAPNAGEALSELNGSQLDSQREPGAAKPTGIAPEIAPATLAAKPSANAAANGGRVAAKPAHPLADHPNESVRKLAKAYHRNPAGTNADLAKRARVSTGTANRYMAEVRIAFGSQGESDSDSQERAPGALIHLPLPEPSQRQRAAVNGYPFQPEEN